MFRKVLILAAVTLIQYSFAEQDVPGKLVKSRRSFATFSNFAQECKSTGHYVECDSCTSYMVCLIGQKMGNSCPEHKPYCNNKECSAVPDYSTCPVSSLNCTGEGFYPDPKACQFYHYCESAGMPSDVYECPSNYFFNTQTTMCRRKSNESDCVSVECDPERILQRYGSSNTYFAFCRDQDILMVKCDNNHVLTGTGCVFQCPWEGLFAHADPSKYYMCFYPGIDSKLEAKLMSCPLNREFNKIKGVCVTPSA